MPARALSELVSQLLVAYTIEYDNEYEHHMPHGTTAFGVGGPEPFVSQSGQPVRRLWLTSMAMWSNFIRYVPPEGIALELLEDLPANRPGLERWGYITISADGLVKATRAGRWAQAGWRRLDGVIDRRWEERFGAEVVGELRAALLVIARQVAAGMPLYMPMVGYADGMRSRYRDPASTGLVTPDVSERDLSGLLSAVLLAFSPSLPCADRGLCCRPGRGAAPPSDGPAPRRLPGRQLAWRQVRIAGALVRP